MGVLKSDKCRLGQDDVITLIRLGATPAALEEAYAKTFVRALADKCACAQWELTELARRWGITRETAQKARKGAPHRRRLPLP